MVYYPHVCWHGEGEIEWCRCVIRVDHTHDDPRIEPHECRGDPEVSGSEGWWQNPVDQRMRDGVL